MSKLFKFRGGGKSQRTSTPIRHSQTTKVSSFDKSHCTTGHDEPDTTYRPESSQAFSECLRTRQTQPFITILICIRTGHLIIPSSSRLFFFSLSGVASLNGASCCGLQTNSESIALKDTQLTGFGALWDVSQAKTLCCILLVAVCQSLLFIMESRVSIGPAVGLLGTWRVLRFGSC